MLTSGITTTITLLAILGLLVTTPFSAAAELPIVDGTHEIALAIQDDEASESEESDEEDDEQNEDSGGWLDTMIDTGGDIVGGAKDTTVDAAGATWDVVQGAPGAVWGVAEQAPGAVWSVATGGWNWLRDASSKSITWDGWADFLNAHPVLGTILAPLVLLLFGLSSDGSISYLDFALTGLLFLIPAAKGIQVIGDIAAPVLSRVSRGQDVVGTMRRIPGLIQLDPSDSLAFLRARTINPALDVISKLPSSPGVYVILDANGTPIYVGMSSSIKRRLTDHFTPPRSAFADEAASIKTIPRKSSTDALTLECRLIKAFRPIHNVVHNNDRPCPIYIDPSVPVHP